MNHAKAHTKEGLLEIIDALPLSISVIDQNRSVALANKATYKFVNKNESQLIGHIGGDAFGCIHHDDVPEGCGFGQDCLKCKLRQTIQYTMELKKPHRMVETAMVFKNHGKRYLKIHTLPMVLSGDEVVLLAIEDITEAKRYEEAQVEKEKLSAVIETAGAVCHEINQPLMVISGYSEILQMDLSEDNPQYEILKNISDQICRLGEITKKLRCITKYKTKSYLKGNIIDIDEASQGELTNVETTGEVTYGAE